MAQHGSACTDKAEGVGIERTNGASGRSRGVDLILQYHQRLLDEEHHAAQVGGIGAPAPAVGEAPKHEQAESGWDRLARAFDQAGAQDTRARRWRELSQATRADGEAPQHVQSVGEARIDAPIAPTDRSDSARRAIQGAPHLAIPDAPIGRPRRTRTAAETTGPQTSASTRERSAAKGLGVQTTLPHRPMGAFAAPSSAITMS